MTGIGSGLNGLLAKCRRGLAEVVIALSVARGCCARATTRGERDGEGTAMPVGARRSRDTEPDLTLFPHVLRGSRPRLGPAQADRAGGAGRRWPTRARVGGE